jgi:hypothetical protein
MGAGVFPTAHCESDQPEYEEYHGRDPQKMNGEAESEEKQNEQQRKNE